MFRKTITLGLDYKEFTGGTQEINRKLRLLDDEFRLASEQMKGFGDESSQTELKQERLRQRMILQEKAVEEAKNAYEKAIQTQETGSKKLDYADSQLLKARTALEKTKNELAELDQKMDESGKRTEELGSVTELLNKKLELSRERHKQSAESLGGRNEQYQILTEKVKNNAEAVELARKRYEAAAAAEEKDETALRNLESQLLETEIALESSKNELDAVGQKMEEGAGKGDTFGDSIRGIASTLGLQTSPAVEALAKKFDGLSKGMGGAILGIGTIIGTLASFTVHAAGVADELLTLSSTTGISTDSLQKFSYASDLLDVSVDTMQSSMTKMIRSMTSARNGTEEAQEAYRKLHIRVTDTTGQLRDGETVFYETIDALGKVANETERDSLAMTIFGKSARDLNPLIEAGSEALKGFGEEAENVGAVMSEEELKKFGKLQDSFDRLKQTGEALKNNLGLILLPIMTKIFDAISQLSVEQLATAVKVIGAIATAILAFKIFESIMKSVDKVKTFFDVTNKGFSGMFVKIMGAVLAITALAAIIAILAGKTNDIERVGASVGNMASSINQSVANSANESNRVSYNATGTRDFEGGETIVGEGGPERIRLPKGTRIYSNYESQKMDGGDIYYFNLQTDSVKGYNTLINIAQNERRVRRMQ